MKLGNSEITVRATTKDSSDVIGKINSPHWISDNLCFNEVGTNPKILQRNCLRFDKKSRIFDKMGVKNSMNWYITYLMGFDMWSNIR